MLAKLDSHLTATLRLHGQALSRLWIAIVLLTVWGAGVVLLEEFDFLPGKISPVPFTFIGMPIGFFLAFRGNQGYARYWEARQHWATVGNFLRNFARDVSIYLRSPNAEDEPAVEALKRDAIVGAIAYAHALRCELTQGDPLASARSIYQRVPNPARHPEQPLLELLPARNVPYDILRGVIGQLDWAYRRGWLDRIFLRHLDAQFSQASDAAGSCIKIRDTPMPVPLVILTKRMLLIYLFFLPVGIVDMTGWFAPVVQAVISFAFLGLDAIAAELGHPFETGPNQIALETTTYEIETDLRALLADSPPQAPPAKNGIIP